MKETKSPHKKEREVKREHHKHHHKNERSGDVMTYHHHGHHRDEGKGAASSSENQPNSPLRSGKQFRNVLKTLRQEDLFGQAVATLEEFELFTTAELKEYVRQYEHFRALTNVRTEDSMMKRDVLENWMEWICLILELYLECCERLRLKKIEHSASVEGGDDDWSSNVALAQLMKARNSLRKSLMKNLTSLSKKFKTNRRVDFTILDLYLRIGAVDKFDSFVTSSILRYPTEPNYWYLAIRRRIATGDYFSALTMCQKALKYLPKDQQLDQCLRRLSLIIAAMNAASKDRDSKREKKEVGEEVEGGDILPLQLNNDDDDSSSSSE